MEKERFKNFYHSHQGGINGALIGSIVAILILIIGFFKSLFIAICMGIGYYIGKRTCHDNSYIKNLLDRVLPPGTYR